jgi:diketogulonate reductase-like aldo/keto reductase
MALAPTLPMPRGEIPRIAYGTGTFWGHYKTGVSRDEVNDGLVTAIQSAIGAGVRHLDCAEMYGSELSVGEGLRRVLGSGGGSDGGGGGKGLGVTRGELWITSKAWNTSKGSAEELRTACLGSLQRLGLSYLDLYLLHSPFGPDGNEVSAESKQATWSAMEALHAEGLVRNIGVSNHRVKDLEEIMTTATVQPAVNQIEFNPILFRPAQELLSFCRERGIVIEACECIRMVTPSSSRVADFGWRWHVDSALSSLVYEGAKGTALDACVQSIAEVSPLLACIGSPCLRHWVHGASIGGRPRRSRCAAALESASRDRGDFDQHQVTSSVGGTAGDRV